MTGRLAGKIAIVTGGNSGMGASTVELIVLALLLEGLVERILN